MAWHLSNTVARCSLESRRSLAGVPSSPIWSRSTFPAKRLPNLVIIRSPPSVANRGHQPAAVLRQHHFPLSTTCHNGALTVKRRPCSSSISSHVSGRSAVHGSPCHPLIAQTHGPAAERVPYHTCETTSWHCGLRCPQTSARITPAGPQRRCRRHPTPGGTTAPGR